MSLFLKDMIVCLLLLDQILAENIKAFLYGLNFLSHSDKNIQWKDLEKNFVELEKNFKLVTRSKVVGNNDIESKVLPKASDETRYWLVFHNLLVKTFFQSNERWGKFLWFLKVVIL